MLDLKPTRDIIATLARQARPSQWMVAFALEPDGDPARALKKITAKKNDNKKTKMTIKKLKRRRPKKRLNYYVAKK